MTLHKAFFAWLALEETPAPSYITEDLTRHHPIFGFAEGGLNPSLVVELINQEQVFVTLHFEGGATINHLESTTEELTETLNRYIQLKDSRVT